jgi:hypothetical protein
MKLSDFKTFDSSGKTGNASVVPKIYRDLVVY